MNSFKEFFKFIFRLFQISRPLGWVMASVLFLVGIKLSGPGFDLLTVVQLVFLTFPFCFFLFGINDVFDYKSDKLNPRKGNFLHGAKITKDEIPIIKKLAWLFILPLVLVSAFVNLYNFVFAVLLVLFSYFYSAKPIRMKEIPLLDTISNSIIVYLVVMLGFTHHALPSQLTIKGYFLLILLTGFNAYHTIVDFDADRKAGHKTFASFFGKRATAGFAFLCALVALLFGNFESFEFNALVLFSAIATFATLIYPKIAKILMYICVFGGIALVSSWLVRTL